MDDLSLIREVVVGRSVTWSDLHSNCFVRQRLEHIFIRLIVTHSHDKIIFLIIQKLFCN